MHTLNRKLARDLWRSKFLLLAITSIIAAGVACFVAMRSAFFNMERAKASYYSQCRMADFWIDVKKAPLPELDTLGDVHGVSEIAPRITFLATADLPDVIEPINSYVISLPDERTANLNDIVIRQGSYFTDRRDNEVIVNASFAREHRLQPGDYIHLLLNNRRQELFVVGTAISSEFAYLLGPGALIPDPKHFGVFYIKQTYAEDAFDFQGAANQFIGRLAPEYRQRPDDVLARLEERLDDYGVATTTALEFQTSNQFLSSEIQQLGMFSTILPAIFLSVAAMILNVLMMRLARQQRVVVGTLKAMGLSDGQVFWHYLKFGASVGFIGGVLGCLGGFWLSTGYTAIYRQFYEFPDLRSGIYAEIYAIGIAVSVVCAVLGSSYSIWGLLELRPAEAMRPEPPRKGGRILIEQIAFIWNRLTAAWRTALRSVFRHKLRSGAAVFASAMGACILMTGFLSNAAIRKLIDFQLREVMRSDLDLSLESERGEDALDELRNMPAVHHVEPLLTVACTFSSGPYHRKGGVTGLTPGARLTIPRDAQGRALRVPSTGLLMSRRLAELLHLKPGDRVTIEPIKGERRPVEAVVSRITDSYLGMSVYADIHYLSRLVGEEFAISGMQIDLTGDERELHALYRELKQLPAVEAVNTREQLVDRLVDTVLKFQGIAIGFLIGFAGVIFFGSIVNASLVNLAERQREVATLVAMGQTHWQVGSVFLRESLVTSIAGTILGLPLGYSLMLVVAKQVENDVMRFPIVFSFWAVAATLLLALLFAVIAHGFVQWQINRMDIVEALKVKE